MPDMRVEGSVTITTEEEARKNPKGKNVSNEEFEVGKSLLMKANHEFSLKTMTRTRTCLKANWSSTTLRQLQKNKTSSS
jgi:hypothetical protein